MRSAHHLFAIPPPRCAVQAPKDSAAGSLSAALKPCSLSTQADHALQVFDEQLPITQPRRHPPAAPMPNSGKLQPCSIVQKLEATARLKPGQPTLAPLQPASALLHPDAGPTGPMQSLSQPPGPPASGFTREPALIPWHPKQLHAPQSKALLSSDGALTRCPSEPDFSGRPGQQQAQHLQPCTSAGSHAAAPVAQSEGAGAIPAMVYPAMDRATLSFPDADMADPSPEPAPKAPAPEAASGEAAAGQSSPDPEPRAYQAQVVELQGPHSSVLAASAHCGLQSLTSGQQTQYEAPKLTPDDHVLEPGAAVHVPCASSSDERASTLPLIEAIISAVYPAVSSRSAHTRDQGVVVAKRLSNAPEIKAPDGPCVLHALTPCAVQEEQMPLEVPLLVPASYHFANQQAYQMIR